MVKEIRIYIEGGGDSTRTLSALRAGFSKFFKKLLDTVISENFTLNITMCGKRNDAFRDFKIALKSHSDAFNILLVDAEAPVTKDSPWEHLKLRDNWDKPAGVDDDNCHLMVQTMEAWFIADIATLKEFYGQGFKENGIPKTNNVETIPKDNLERILKTSSGKTTKGEYHKIKHASKLLELLDVTKVRQSSPYCDRLFNTLKSRIRYLPDE
ncbi:DUF4276 family protein [Anabaena sphaerica FACHB-251]|uniref:DUF4276 family protein n=1 Tax=Anabaena sphaerica FACHB-251 TaxID=2692883 RepID=A0A926WIW6_9NOST|nr:DUF4276 family protein [Anabaena sphaerica]MBD2294955.1 DUF4276 family protein [Anabaena sphaerica FACHB-251]